MQRKLHALLALLVLASLVLAACGGAGSTSAPSADTSSGDSGEDSSADDEMSAQYDPASVTGDIVTAGSSTVFPLSERMAELFRREGFAGNITVDSIGSGAGYERFCEAAESDISNASRGIRDSEVEACQANDREPLEFRVGTDGLSVVVSSDNDFVTDVSFEELQLIFSTAETWADVRPDWPDEPIQRFIPGTDSGTFDFFVEEVFDEDEAPILGAANTQLSEDDNVLVQGVLGSQYAIGFFGYAYYVENTDTLNLVAIDGVEPNEVSVEDGSYLLARPLFLYSDATIMQSKPQVAAFLYYYLTNVNDEVVDVGYFPASEAALQSAWDNFDIGAGMAQPMELESSVDPALDPASVSGDVVTAGSSTVFPLSERMAELFRREGFAGNITVDSIGSGAGYERFCEATESDISNASRGIRDSEVEACQANGREPLEFRVGTDGIAIVVSSENEFASDVTFEELQAIFSTAKTWAEVHDGWPAEPIQRFIPGTDSGTFDFFVEEVFDEDEAPILAASNTQLSEDDNVLVQGVLGSPYAIGYFGYAYYAENAGTLNLVAVDGVEPNETSVEDGSYLLARPLFLYSDANIMQSKAQVAAFLYYYLTHVNEEITDVGYFPASEGALQSAWDNFAIGMDQ